MTRFMPVRAVIFDLDGTLMDHAAGATPALRAGLQAVLLDRDGTRSADDLWVVSSLDELTFAG